MLQTSSAQSNTSLCIIARNSALAAVCAFGAILLTARPCQALESVPSTIAEYVAINAAATGWTEQELTVLLKKAELQPHIVEIMDRPAEKAMTWPAYNTRIVSVERIVAGKAFMVKYAEALARAESTYGVPREIVTAIIGIESKYGANKGNYRVLDSLSTLSFGYPRRAAFFQKELTAFLILAKAGQLDALTVKGSYAGAIGWPQFMPSSINKLGTDFDGNGIIDLYDSPVDAIGSVAKYFNLNGWQPRQAIVEQLSSPVGSDLTLADKDGPTYFKTEKNFKVIKRYNHSAFYSMAVFNLSERLK